MPSGCGEKGADEGGKGGDVITVISEDCARKVPAIGKSSTNLAAERVKAKREGSRLCGLLTKKRIAVLRESTQHLASSSHKHGLQGTNGSAAL